MAPENLKPIRPPRLKPGDTVAIVAPASPFDRDMFNQGLKVLVSMGFRTLVPDGIFEKNRYLAGSDEHRAKLFAQVFQDPSVDAVVCANAGASGAHLRANHRYLEPSYPRAPARRRSKNEDGHRRRHSALEGGAVELYHRLPR